MFWVSYGVSGFVQSFNLFYSEGLVQDCSNSQYISNVVTVVLHLAIDICLTVVLHKDLARMNAKIWMIIKKSSL